MKIIDARSGRDVKIGETVYWPSQVFGQEGFTLHAVKKIAGKLVGDFTIFAPTIPGGKWRRDVPLIVRFTHPRYFLQRVAFVPT